jgi:hypothetical protein
MAKRSTMAVPLVADIEHVPPCGPRAALKVIHVSVLAPDSQIAVIVMV